MMQWKRSVSRWLAAERSVDVEAAERALMTVFGALFDPAVSPAFAESVLARLEAPSRRLGMSPVVRGAIAVGMFAAAVWIALLPGLAFRLPGILELGALVEFAGVVLIGSIRLLSSWLDLWQTLAEVSRVLLNVASKPVIAGALMTCLLFLALLLRIVSGLMSSSRSGRYA